MRTAQAERMRRGGGRGFTLIEILVVVAILVVLVGLVVAVGTQLRAKAQIARTKQTLKTLDGILQNYEQLTGGTYSATGTTQFVKDFMAMQQTKGSMASLGRSMLVMDNGTPKVLDAFGNAIELRTGGPGGRAYFVSYGPDGLSSTTEDKKDDIYSYDP